MLVNTWGSLESPYYENLRLRKKKVIYTYAGEEKHYQIATGNFLDFDQNTQDTFFS